jgi:formylglycine-generating enzyme required for sulfatase activity
MPRLGAHKVHLIKIFFQMILFSFFTGLSFPVLLFAEERTNQIGIEFVLLDSGTYLMGGDPDFPEETTPHWVEITSPFYIGKKEVTQRQYDAVMGKNNSAVKGPDLPVANVGWEEAHLFVVALSLATKIAYRLPTEAEWEYAARAGIAPEEFKNHQDAYVNQLEWTSENSGSYPRQGCSRGTNRWGLCDMNGNVAEWTSDRYASNFYLRSQVQDPKGPWFGIKRVYRGGSFLHPSSYARPTRRYAELGVVRFSGVGFRVAVSSSVPPANFPPPIAPTEPQPSPPAEPENAPAVQIASAGLPFEYLPADDYCEMADNTTKKTNVEPCRKSDEEKTFRRYRYWFNLPGSPEHISQSEFSVCQQKNTPFEARRKNDAYALDLNYFDNSVEITRRALAIEDGVAVCVVASHGYILIRHEKKLTTGIRYGPNNQSLDDNLMMPRASTNPKTYEPPSDSYQGDLYTVPAPIWYSGYMHLDNAGLMCPNHSEDNDAEPVAMAAGCRVKKGDALGLIDAVGVQAYHLHFAVYDKDKYSFSPYYLRTSEEANIGLSYGSISYGGVDAKTKPCDTQTCRNKKAKYLTTDDDYRN